MIAGIQAAAPKLCGVAEQGGILFGESDTHNVYFNNKRVSNNGVFTIGLAMDAPEKVSIKFCKKGIFGACQTFEYSVGLRKYPEQHVTVPERFVTWPDDIAKRIAQENDAIRAARDVLSDGVFFMEARPPLPLEAHRITSVYGARRVFNGQPRRPHNGIDFAGEIGTKFTTIAPGTVVLVGDFYLTGKTVFVDHGNRIISAYFHMDEIKVEVGNEVLYNTVLGTVGNTGRSSGPHLHLGIYWHQIALDPAFFIK